MPADVVLMTLSITCNQLNANGGYAICEYGTLYSQNISFSTAPTLTLDALGQLYVGKSSCCRFLKPGAYYGNTIENLDSRRCTYFRSFALNTNNEFAYGLIRSVANLTDIQEQLPDQLIDANTEVGISGGAYYTYDEDTGTYVYLGLVEDEG